MHLRSKEELLKENAVYFALETVFNKILVDKIKVVCTWLNGLTLNAILKIESIELDRWWTKWWLIPIWSARLLYIQKLLATRGVVPFGEYLPRLIQYCPSLAVVVYDWTSTSNSTKCSCRVCLVFFSILLKSVHKFTHYAHVIDNTPNSPQIPIYFKSLMFFDYKY